MCINILMELVEEIRCQWSKKFEEKKTSLKISLKKDLKSLLYNNHQIYLYIYAESGNCHMGELPLVKIITKGNRDLFSF